MKVNTWDAAAASKPAYRVLAPVTYRMLASVAYWYRIALIADQYGRSGLRDRCLAAVERMATEDRHGEM